MELLYGTSSRDFDQDERHVVGGRATAPGFDSIQNLTLHFRQRQLRSLSDDFSEASTPSISL